MGRFGFLCGQLNVPEMVHLVDIVLQDSSNFDSSLLLRSLTQASSSNYGTPLTVHAETAMIAPSRANGSQRRDIRWGPLPVTVKLW